MPPAISVIYITARGPRPFVHHPEWDQYEVLGRCLAAQTHRDYQLVVVTPHADKVHERFDSGWAGEGTVVTPRDTPWRRARTFAVASALNTGLIHARGEWCLVLGDCCEFGPGLLDRLAFWANHGFGVALMVAAPGGNLIDMRARWFNDRKNADRVVYLSQYGDQAPVPQGLVFFPLEAALGINGYDEHFDGGRGLEDVDFGTRLQQIGVPFVMDEQCVVTMHPHKWDIDPEIIDEKEQVVRCCNPAWALARKRRSPVANMVQYTGVEQEQVLRCMFWNEGKCGYYGNTQPCGYPFGEKGHPTAWRVMCEEPPYEPLFDLREERAKVGL